MNIRFLGTNAADVEARGTALIFRMRSHQANAADGFRGMLADLKHFIASVEESAKVIDEDFDAAIAEAEALIGVPEQAEAEQPKTETIREAAE